MRASLRPTRIAEALSRRVLLLGVLVLAVGAALLVVGFLATTGPPLQAKYRIDVAVPADAPVLRRGQAVRIGGRLAGLISDVTPRRGGGATVTANITKRAFRPLPADTRAYVRVHSIVYETYLELRPGTADRELGDGDTVRAAATSGVDLLEVVQLFDERTRENLRSTVVDVGVGLAGRGRDLNAALGDTPPLARDLAAQAGALARDETALEHVVAGGAQVARGAKGPRPGDVAGLLGALDRTLGAVDRQRGSLRRAIRLAPGFERSVTDVAPDARPLLGDVAALSREARPAVRALNRTTPVVDELLRRGTPLRTEVDRIADVVDPLLRAARPVVFDLFPTMTTLGPLNEDLKTLLSRVGPYRTRYRIPGEPGVKKGTGEIAQAGKRFIDATNDPFDGGLAPGAPAWRVVPVLSPRPCQNPFPAPGEADRDTIRGTRCARGGK